MSNSLLWRKGGITKRPIFLITLAFIAGELSARAGIYGTKWFIAGIFMPVFLSFMLRGLERSLRDLPVMSKGKAGEWAALSVLLSVSVLAGGGLYLGASAPSAGIEAFLGEKEEALVCVKGRVTKHEHKNSGTWIYLADCSLEGCRFSAGGVILIVPETGGIPKRGWEIRAEGRLGRFDEATNPGVFDLRAYYHHLGYDSRAEADSWTRTGGHTDYLREWAAGIAERIDRQIQKIAEEPYGGIYSAMLVGKRENLDEEIRELYTREGISHILSISGLHLSVLGFLAYRAVRRASGSFLLAGLAGGMLICFYGLMCGERLALVRAVCMFLVSAGAKARGRIYDMPTAASAAALFLLTGNPNAIFLSSFQYSFAAIIGIGFLGEYLKKLSLGRWSLRGIGERKGRMTDRRAKRNVPGRFIFSMLRVLSLHLCLLPVNLWHNYAFSPWTILINLLVLPFTAFLLIDAAAALAVSCFSLKAGRILLFPGNRILDYYELLCRIFACFPYGRGHSGQPPVYRIALYCLLPVLLSLAGMMAERTGRRERLRKAFPESGILRGPRQRKPREIWKIGGGFYRRVNRVKAFVVSAEERAKPGIILLIALLCLIAGMRYLHALQPDGLRITVLDVGQGDGNLIETGDGGCLLIDAGSSTNTKLSENVLEPVLFSKGIDSVDAVFLSHADADHVNGILDMLKEGKIRVGEVFLPEAEGCEEEFSEILAAAETARTRVSWVARGDLMKAGELTMFVCAPGRGESGTDNNEKSMVLRLEYGDFSMLFTGDISGEKEKRLDAAGNVDVLKVAHHGSKYSTTAGLLAKIRPKIATISCAKKNVYGHPSDEVMQRLAEAGASVFLTGRGGAIVLESDGRAIKVMYYRKNPAG